MKTKVGSYTKLVDKYGASITKVYYRFRHHCSVKGGGPHQGTKECKRRVAQGRAGECYVHLAQYPSQHTFLPVNF